ncbi:hypothetical protein CKA32_006468 [Geitlerinema sp. FC II]|nr:hypothetical protein CKA32_006468 [Geitlerinema sp. FC II]
MLSPSDVGMDCVGVVAVFKLTQSDPPYWTATDLNLSTQI